MDLVEVAARFTQAIMDRPNSVRKGAPLEEQYVETFAELLKHLRAIIPAEPVTHTTPAASHRPTTEIFPQAYSG